MKTILLHICCGPCSLMPLSGLIAEGFAPAAYFFNPNIHPELEYRLRLRSARAAAGALGVPFLAPPRHGIDDCTCPESSAGAQQSSELAAARRWTAHLAGTFRHGERCRLCYRERLDETALFAAEHGYDAFSTSLLYSRYQLHDIIKSEAEAAAERHGIPFLYRDWRARWQAGIDLSAEWGLYRQKWCGCIISHGEALAGEKRRALEKQANLEREAARREIAAQKHAERTAENSKRKELKRAARSWAQNH